MRMAYERPMMRAELYATNAYCGACTTNPQLDGTLTVKASQWQSDVDGLAGDWEDTWVSTGYGPNASGYYMFANAGGTQHDLTFSSENSTPITSTDANGKEYTGYYWTTTCNCCTSGTYYLEYSAGFTDREGKDCFILYYEDNGQTGLQLGTGSSFPLDNGSSGDMAVAWATFELGTLPNS